MNPIQTYLSEIQTAFGTGATVKETSYYPYLKTLFDAVGAQLSPRVHCIIHLSGGKAGIPDGGFFTLSQVKTASKGADESEKLQHFQKTPPERGVLEVKGAQENLDTLRQSAQVAKYLEKYGLVLLCNLREFSLVERDEKGKVVEIEGFSLCDEAKKFWSLVPSKFAGAEGDEALEFLKRCLMRGAPLESPQDVAAFLASYARQARLQLESAPLEVLLPLKTALEKTLGLTFQAVDKPGKKLSEAEKQAHGEHFFRATLVQTLFYGLFSAWLSHVKNGESGDFNWKLAQYSLDIPMIKTLFSELVKVGNVQLLGLEALLKQAADTLNRVKTDAFFAKWGDAGAIQYFYEPFLERFDPVLRKDLGVYYTPPEIVRYMVTRVDRLLESELGLKGGLANEDVIVLDPCCGTGAFVVETLRAIGKRLESSVPSNQVAGKLRTAALNRVFGFEILPAPFIVAHHQVADLLGSYETKFREEHNERARIYLTNALTGWAMEPDTPISFPEFAEERHEAQKVKQNSKIIVILGNPPYDAFAKIEEDSELTAPYKKGLREEWGIKKWNLDDLYIRFFRIAQRKLTHNDKGILCFISNFSYLREPSYVVMRQELLGSFSNMWVDVLNGDSRETGKRTPEGKPDPSVFSTPFNREGIKVGTSIATMVRPLEQKRREHRILSRELWGQQKREDLLASLDVADFDSQYEEAKPATNNRFSLRPRNIGAEYETWPRLIDLCEIAPMNGLMEKRGGALVALDRDTLQERMGAYFDPQNSMQDVAQIHRGLASDAARFDAEGARQRVLLEDPFNSANVLPYFIRPFDLRWCYYTKVRPLWNEPRPSLRKQLWQGNSFLISRPIGISNPEGISLSYTSTLGDNDALRGHAYYFPTLLRNEDISDLEVNEEGRMVESKVVKTKANLSVRAREYLSFLGFEAPDGNHAVAALVWHHALVIGYASLYREEHGDGLSGDWPRVPLPGDAQTLRASAALGSQVAGLLDLAVPFEGIESGAFRRELDPFGLLSRVDGKGVDGADTDLRLLENWGFFGPRGIVQPGTVEISPRDASDKERECMTKLGVADIPRFCDLYLNKGVFWSGVPLPVWETLIGGYPVLKKWLSYRDERIIGRPLHDGEAREFETIIRRMTLLWSMGAALNANYSACAANVWAWNSSETPDGIVEE